jgi:AraC-like DNA-binding protein
MNSLTIEKIMRAVQSKPMTITEIARQAGVSRSSAHRFFKMVENDSRSFYVGIMGKQGWHYKQVIVKWYGEKERAIHKSAFVVWSMNDGNVVVRVD